TGAGADGPSAIDTSKVHIVALRALPDGIFAIVRAGEARPGATGEPFGTGSAAGSFHAGDADPLDHDVLFERVFDSDDTRVYRLLK
ncbi:MAG: hypothetical protein SGI90_16155, partial [Candidatus Eisenbacteria bacterium]|nr:hypothetical protein [Candidatus Eisenbacteria bacterium]